MKKTTNYRQIPVIANKSHKNKLSIVLVTGVFDLLHQGHIQFLQKAKAKGDIIFVGLESDQRVKQIKGKERPLEPVEVRINKVAQLPFVDFVFALPVKFDSIEREHLIKNVRPDFLAVSAHSEHLDQKRALVEKYGGKFTIVMDHDKRFSTSILVLKKQSLIKSAK